MQSVILRRSAASPLIQRLVSRRTMSTAEEKQVLVERRGALGSFILNRPRALNALTLDMVTFLNETAKTWNKDPNVKVFTLKGAGDKAFCAGGDVVRIAGSGQTDGEVAKAFFREEYRADYTLANLGKPLVSMLNGIVMGGGVGVSVHGPFQIATEKTLFAMPETAIGLIPDVGGSYFLPRLRGSLGMYLGLTGARLKGEDVYKAGIASHYMTSDNLLDIEHELSNVKVGSDEEVQHILEEYHHSSPERTGSFEEHMEAINDCFGAPSLLEVFDRLESNGSEWSRKQLAILREVSPISLHITFEQIKRGATMDLASCLKMEYTIVQHLMKGNDFYQGVRAKLMKGPPAKWQHSSVHHVRREEVQAYFAPADPLVLQ